MMMQRAANDNSRHPDLAQYRQALGWFYRAVNLPEQPFGAANDNSGEGPSLVIDVNPELKKAEELIAAHATGALRVASVGRTYLYLVTVGGEEEPRTYRVPMGAITHVYGEPVTQEVGRIRPSRSKAAIADRKANLDWYCKVLGALPPGRPRRLLKRRMLNPTPDWSRFAHIRAKTLEQARETAGLPPADRLPAGLPYTPEPWRLFTGMPAGCGSLVDGDGSASRVKRPDSENYGGEDAIVDRIALEQFQANHPDHYATLLAVTTAGSMADLVPSNDNKSGKRKLVRAAEALRIFLAA